MSALLPRTVVDSGITYKVNRLYSSGVGAQYACTTKASDGKETTILISEETLDQDPAHANLFMSCERRFDDSLTFAKHIGSSSFWQASAEGGQATVPPGTVNKRK
jgi:hypothetical protein